MDSDTLSIDITGPGMGPGEQPGSEEECSLYYGNVTLNGVHCSTAWDTISCWPPTASGNAVSRFCNLIFTSVHLDLPPEDIFANAKAYRICSDDGIWLWGNWTNYTQCLDAINTEQNIPMAVGYILFIGSALSLLTLAVTLFIFCHFKSLYCSRLQVHRNLVLALVFHSTLLLLVAGPSLFSSSIPLTHQADWLCKTIILGKLYASMATINWMFVEGLLLHSRIAISVFRQEAPFKIYYFIGWGAPIIFLSVWTYFTITTIDEFCWKGYGKSPYVWIITGPMISVLSVNAVFLVNIIRILLGKLRGNSSVEIAQISKAVKATALLFPLLGIPHLLFCINPGQESGLQSVYMICNAFLQSSQGLFVAVLYCFMNTEVQIVVRNAYLRAILRRNPNHKYCRGRTLSRTSTTFLSTYDRTRLDTANQQNSAK